MEYFMHQGSSYKLDVFKLIFEMFVIGCLRLQLSCPELRQQLLAYCIFVCLCLGQTQWFHILLLRHLPTFILNLL